MRLIASALALFIVVATGDTATAACVGDCDGDGNVTILDLVQLIGCVLPSLDIVLPPCPCFADVDGNGDVTVNEVITAVNNALYGCPPAEPTTTSTPTPPPPTATPTATATGSGNVEEFVAQASDFECLASLPKVRHFRVVNKLGHGAAALSVASAAYDVSGLEFPVGTILQLIPTEAMVKRGGGFDPANHDWEYFSLKVTRTGTTIAERGRDEVVNFTGSNCFSCHSAAQRYDFVCENNHGCVPIPLSDDVVNLLQTNDVRCNH